MRYRQILVVGGTGFVGGRLVSALAAHGERIRVAARRRDRARHLILLPTVDVIEADVHDPRQLAALADGCDAVVNLVGILHGRRGRPDERGLNDYGPDFAKAHVELVQAVVDACRAAGARRLLHVSALGAAMDAPSEYLRSKACGEQAVLAASDLAVTVLRPAVMFGPDDRFLNMFAALARFVPVLGAIRPDWRCRPVYVGDVVEAMLRSLDAEPGAARGPFELCGPREYTMRELVALACALAGRRRLVIGVPDWIAVLQAAFLEKLPNPILSRDNLRSLEVDCVSDAAFPFGIVPRSIESMAAVSTPGAPRGRGADPRARYADLRWRAHR